MEFFKSIDFYGKLPELYLKGKTKKVTWIGRIFSIIFILIYIIFFIYKLIRLFKRVDIVFYDSVSGENEELSINITKNNFYFNFAFVNSSTYEPFLDETIYYPKGFINDKILEIKPCTIDKVGSEYSELFKDMELDNYYCIENINYDNFMGYQDYFLIRLFPCKNSTENNNHCKPKEEIDNYLHYNYLSINLQDIQLTPLNYSSPVKHKITNVEGFIFKNIGEYVYIEMQIVNIETDTNIIGFDFFSKDKIDTFIKYDLFEFFSVPGYNLNDEDNNEPISNIEIQIKDSILTQKRNYAQLIDVLGEVGGFMEIISSFFNLISSFLVDIIYENSLINELFEFDLKNKLISIKTDKNSENNKNIKNLIESDNDKVITIDCETLNNNSVRYQNSKIRRIRSKIINLKNDEIINKSFDINNEININQKQKKNFETSSCRYENKENNNNSEKNQLYLRFNKKKESNLNFNIEKLINNNEINKFFIPLKFWFTCNNSNFNKILLNESKNIISEKLDIITIFKTIFFTEKIITNYSPLNKYIKMPENCINSLGKVNNNY